MKAKLLRAAIAGVGALSLVAPTLGLGATHVYANAPMGAGGTWSGGFHNTNYNRMSAPSHGVSIQFCFPPPPGGGSCWPEVNTVNFVQQSLSGGYGGSYCKNHWATITNGYCAWYD